MRLEVVDLPISVLPDRLGHELLDAHDEHVLVVRAVEDADAPLARRGRVDAPQEVVAQLLLGRDAEAGDPRPLRVEGGDRPCGSARPCRHRRAPGGRRAAIGRPRPTAAPGIRRARRAAPSTRACAASLSPSKPGVPRGSIAARSGRVPGATRSRSRKLTSASARSGTGRRTAGGRSRPASRGLAAIRSRANARAVRAATRWRSGRREATSGTRPRRRAGCRWSGQHPSRRPSSRRRAPSLPGRRCPDSRRACHSMP